MPLTYRWNPPDAPDLVARNLKAAPSWLPKSISQATHKLGPAGVNVLREAVAPNLYTGALSDSVSAEYAEDDRVVTISPKALRGGKWDAGLLLEFGTKPIPNAPWAPIAAWAAFKGAPMPGAWLKIRQLGVSPHPFLDRALEMMGYEIDPVLGELLDDVIAHLFEGWT